MLCLPRSEGGLGVLNPTKQLLVLQMKWLFPLFSAHPSHLREMLLHHFTLMTPCASEPLFTFYSSDHRSHALAHPTSVVHSMYKTFDHFGINFSLHQVPLSVLLQFPLWRFFQSVPPDHWLQRHRTLPALHFFAPTTGSVSLTVRRPGTYDCYPTLLFRLYREVIVEKHMELTTFVSALLNPSTAITPYLPLATALSTQLTSCPLWSRYTSRTFRFHE